MSVATLLAQMFRPTRMVIKHPRGFEFKSPLFSLNQTDISVSDKGDQFQYLHYLHKDFKNGKKKTIEPLPKPIVKALSAEETEIRTMGGMPDTYLRILATLVSDVSVLERIEDDPHAKDFRKQDLWEELIDFHLAVKGFSQYPESAMIDIRMNIDKGSTAVAYMMTDTKFRWDQFSPDFGAGLFSIKPFEPEYPQDGLVESDLGWFNVRQAVYEEYCKRTGRKKATLPNVIGCRSNWEFPNLYTSLNSTSEDMLAVKLALQHQMIGSVMFFRRALMM